MTDASSVSLGGETAKGTIAKLVMALGGFVGTIVFARILGPVGIGGFYLLFSLVKIADRPVSGWANAGKKRFSEASTARDEIVGAQFLFVAVWFICTVGAAYAFSGGLRSYTGLPNAPLLFVLLMAAVMLFEPFSYLVQARGLVGVATQVDTLRSYLTLPLQLVLVGIGLGAAGMAYGLIGGTFLAVPLLLYYVRTVPALPSTRTVRNLWAFARYSIPTSVVGKAYDRFDVLLLGVLLAPGAVGQYEVAAKLTLPAVFVAEVAGSGLMARVSNLESKGKKTYTDVSNTLSFSSILSIPIFFGAVALSRPLVVTLYGAAFAPAAPLLLGLALARVVSTQNGPLSQTIAGLDRPEVIMRISVLTLAFNIVAGVILTIQFGAVGVVIATVLAEMLKYEAFASIVRREYSDASLLTRTFVEQVGAGLVMFVVVTGVHRFVPVRSWPHLVGLVTVGAIVYGGMLLSVSPQLRLTIGSVLRGSRIERYVPHRILNW